ncbi:hypothetical protein [Actinopolyspora mortivallis]|uniref:Uncharacterized protein n=1 Tax=Actinopolyspora mortivallis TaxID=33906 RepID=A0A2T0H1U2_ACTMO|nr:hypothetical protein [Actinopolyspora mortivallis]PRW65349.1 hypothetical protein CEP50_02245 [Actinopolyspora mortivallis]
MLLLEAEYSASAKKWLFVVQGRDLAPRSLLALFGANLPEVLAGLTVDDVVVEFDHLVTAITVVCFADLTMDGKKATLHFRSA